MTALALLHEAGWIVGLLILLAIAWTLIENHSNPPKD